MLKEIRIHGRGGQGVVSLAELLALAAYYDGKCVQAFPSFGVERRGAPIEAYVRISDKKIYRRDHIANPNYLIIVDDTLLGQRGILNGLDKGDMILVNSKKSEEELKRKLSIYPDVKIKAFDATSLGLEIIGKPIVNTAMIGAFSFITGIVGLAGAKKAIQEKFSVKGAKIVSKNIELLQKAHDHFNPHKQPALTRVRRGRYMVVSGEQELMVIGETKMQVDS